MSTKDPVTTITYLHTIIFPPLGDILWNIYMALV